MELDRVRGQDAAVRFLKKLLRSGAVPQAMLFTGPPGVGKRTAAVALGRDLLCLRGRDACGECDSCRLMRAGSHPDMAVVGADRSRKEIVLDDVRGFLKALSLKPLYARKCAVLVDAERMNAYAQNSLLKSLEEPPPSTVFCLTSSNPEALLETVRSRCATVRFGPLRAEVLAQVLGVEIPDAAGVLRASSGSARLARALLDGRDLAGRAKELCSPAEKEGDVQLLRSADRFAEAAKKAGALEAAAALLSAGRDILTRSPDDAAAGAALDEVIQAAKALRSNVRPALVMRCLAWKLKEIRNPKAIPA